MFRRFPFRSKQRWEAKVAGGLVRIADGNELKPGVFVEHHNPSVTEPAVPGAVEILHETDDWLATFKPAPMPAHPGGRYYRNSLTEILKDAGYESLKLIHRLDAVTSGIMLFAKTSAFAAKATAAFREGDVDKMYYALVDGQAKQEHWHIDLPIRRKSGFVFETASGDEQAKPALTRFELESVTDSRSLIKCYPVTGRTHQIRLHLLASGLPIVDDLVYQQHTVGEHKADEKPVLQNRAICLINARLRIAKLGVNLELQVPEKWETEP